MDDVQIILLASDAAKEQWRVSCHMMWQDIFDDSDAYMDYYESCKWPVNRVFLLTEGDRLCSMLHLNPYRIRQENMEQELHYIVGVSTEPGVRGRGYMGLLLREAFGYLRGRGEAWTYLMPAAEAIYQPFGFRSVSRAQSIETCFCRRESAGKEKSAGQCDGRRHGNALPSERVYSFGECPDTKKKELTHFAERCLSKRFKIFAVRNDSYWEEISRELEACGGELLILECGGEIIGYTEYMYDLDEEIPVEIAETVLEDGKREQGYAMLGEYLLEHCGQEKLRVLFTESAFLPEQVCRNGSSRCQIMARILNFEQTARSLKRPKDWPERVCCHIADPVMEENHGVWELCFSGEETTVRRVEENPAFCLEIGEFAELFFGQKPLYINDMV